MRGREGEEEAASLWLARDTDVVTWRRRGCEACTMHACLHACLMGKHVVSDGGGGGESRHVLVYWTPPLSYEYIIVLSSGKEGHDQEFLPSMFG